MSKNEKAKRIKWLRRIRREHFLAAQYAAGMGFSYGSVKHERLARRYDREFKRLVGRNYRSDRSNLFPSGVRAF